MNEMELELSAKSAASCWWIFNDKNSSVRITKRTDTDRIIRINEILETSIAPDRKSFEDAQVMLRQKDILFIMEHAEGTFKRGCPVILAVGINELIKACEEAEEKAHELEVQQRLEKKKNQHKQEHSEEN